MLISQHDALMAAEARLLAQRERSFVIAWPNALADRAGDPKVAAIMAGQANILRTPRPPPPTKTEIFPHKIWEPPTEIEGHPAPIQTLGHKKQIASGEIKDNKMRV